MRLDRLGARHLSLKNDIVNAWLMTVVLFAVLTAVFGWVVLPYLIVQAVLGFSLLLLNFPYRLLTQDVTFDEVAWEEHKALVETVREWAGKEVQPQIHDLDRAHRP